MSFKGRQHSEATRELIRRARAKQTNLARGPRAKVPPGARFEARTMPLTESGCVIWLGALSTNGYGAFATEDRKIVRAHRFAYELQVGPIPAGLDLDHLCRTRSCVNVDHLEPVTHRENLRRARA